MLRYIAFAHPSLNRTERVKKVKECDWFNDLNEPQKEFVSFVLDGYKENGYNQFFTISSLIDLQYGSTTEAKEISGINDLNSCVTKIQEALYAS